MSPRIRLALFVPACDVGGAQRQFVNLAIGLHDKGFAVEVLTLHAGAPLEVDLLAAGVRVTCLERRGRLGTVKAMVRLLRYLNGSQVQILYSSHGVPNLMTALLRLLRWPGKTVVGIRATGMDVSDRRWRHRLAYWLEGRLASFADLAIANSQSARRDASERGFPLQRISVVLNGIDVDRFRVDPDAGSALRRKIGVAHDCDLVGMVARVDPQKGHPTWFDAAGRLLESRPSLRFLCIWDGDEHLQRRLWERANEKGLGAAMVWHRGHQTDIVACYNAMDIMVLPSWWGESFSNAVAEAMACGRPCVVSDVGGSAELVGHCGIIVPPRDPAALASGMASLIDRTRREGESLRSAARSRVVENFSVERMVANTLRELSALSNGR